MNDYQQFLSLAQSRRSVRKFSGRAVSRQSLLCVLEAARWAPSNHNRQPWRFIVIEDPGQIARLAETVGAEVANRLKSLPPIASGYASEFVHYATFFSGAPVLILVLHKQSVSFSNVLLQGVGQPELVSGEPLSAAMAVQNLLLAGHALGLGSCVLTAPLIAREVVAHTLNLPRGYEITCLVALGYPDETPAQPRRKSVEQIAEFTQDDRRLGSK
jgi:nitroreductase